MWATCETQTGVGSVKQLGLRILMLGAAFALHSAAVRSEQPQKASRTSQEDRIKKLEERADAAEKAASAATMERDYITRIQKQYESYYQKVLDTEIWALGTMGLILTGVFVLVARFSLKLIDEQTKTATAGATVQMRNEYARALAKEANKLYDTNAADIKKMKEALEAQIVEADQILNERYNFQMQFVHALAEGVDERQGDSLVSFRNALRTYKSGKSRHLIETKVGATTAQNLFASLQKMNAENYAEKAREEMADPLYNGLEEELALAALQSTWLPRTSNTRANRGATFHGADPGVPSLGARSATQRRVRLLSSNHQLEYITGMKNSSCVRGFIANDCLTNGVVSTGQCNTCLQSICRSLKSQSFSWTLI